MHPSAAHTRMETHMTKSLLRLAVAVAALLVLFPRSARPQTCAGWVPGTNTIYTGTNCGNVGIGTPNPAVQLHVFSPADMNVMIEAQNTYSTGTGSAAIIRAQADTAQLTMFAHGSGQTTITPFGITAAGWSELRAGAGNGLIVGTNFAGPLVFGTSGVPRMWLDASGNLGIGTNSPDGIFNVVRNPSPTMILTDSKPYADGDVRTLKITFKTANGGGILTGESASITAFLTPNNGVTVPQSALAFSTASNTAGLLERMRIDPNGNVGIGTQSPDGIFNVVKNASPTIILSDSKPYANGDTRTLDIGFKTNNGDGLLGYESASIKAFLTPTAGVTVPQAALAFSTANNTTGFGERMRIDGNGWVGIGTQSPDGIFNVVKNASPTIVLTDSKPFAEGDTRTLDIGFKTNNAANQFNYESASIKALLTPNAGVTVPQSILTFSTSANSTGFLERMRIDQSGNVGIGTTAPSDRLTVNGVIHSLTGGVTFPDGSTQTVAFAPRTSGDLPVNGNLGVGSAFTQGSTASSSILSNQAPPLTGTLVDIRGATPAYVQQSTNSTQETALWTNGAGLYVDVAGNATAANNYISFRTTNVASSYVPAEAMRIASTGDVTMAHNLNVSGTISGTQVIGATYQDIAEWVPADRPLQPGTVVVLDAASTNKVTESLHAYDTAVAGVVTEHPGVILGKASRDQVKIATVGRVRVHVDATKHPVRVGDLLVTSDRPGTAMVSEPVDLGGIKIHRPGTLIGKALQPLPSGEGDVLVLLSLQ